MQPERTALAWTRTGFAILANALLALRAGYVSDSVPLLAFALALLLGAAYIFIFAGFRRRVLARDASVPVPAAVMALIAAMVLAACITGIVAVAVSSSPLLQQAR